MEAYQATVANDVPQFMTTLRPTSGGPRTKQCVTILTDCLIICVFCEEFASQASDPSPIEHIMKKEILILDVQPINREEFGDNSINPNLESVLRKYHQIHAKQELRRF